MSKDLVLDKEVMAGVKKMVESECSEQIEEIQMSADVLSSWTLQDWNVPLQYQLDIVSYCKAKNIQLFNNYVEMEQVFQQSINLLSLLTKQNDLKNLVQLLKLSWSNIQREVNSYWKDKEVKLTEQKLVLSEDARLAIMAYLVIKSGKAEDIFIAFKTIEHFVNFENYSEAAPLSTLETAFHIILLEYSEQILN